MIRERLLWTVIISTSFILLAILAFRSEAQRVFAQDGGGSPYFDFGKEETRGGYSCPSGEWSTNTVRNWGLGDDGQGECHGCCEYEYHPGTGCDDPTWCGMYWKVIDKRFCLRNPVPTKRPTVPPTAVLTPTHTPIPTRTHTPIPTRTEAPPPPTSTPIPTRTHTPTLTHTPIPTHTPTPTHTHTPTSTHTPTAVATPTATETPLVSVETPAPRPTATIEVKPTAFIPPPPYPTATVEVKPTAWIPPTPSSPQPTMTPEKPAGWKPLCTPPHAGRVFAFCFTGSNSGWWISYIGSDGRIKTGEYVAFASMAKTGDTETFTHPFTGYDVKITWYSLFVVVETRYANGKPYIVKVFNDSSVEYLYW